MAASLSYVGTIHGQYKQIKSAAPAQTVVAKPWYGPEETLLGAYLNNNDSISFHNEQVAGTPYEWGYVFTASKKGQITKVGVRMPRFVPAGPPATVYTVSLWDYESRQLIKQTTVEIEDIRFNYKELDSPVPVVANKKYVISVFVRPAGNNAGPWPYYTIIKPGLNNTAAPFLPITSGPLTLLTALSGSGNSPDFPATISYHTDILSGLCDFVFVPMEK